VAEITPPVLLQTVRKIEVEGSPGLARRMVSAFGQIARFAVARGRADAIPARISATASLVAGEFPG